MSANPWAVSHPQAAQRWFWSIFGLTLVLKLLLAYSFPFTGDEAYLFQWGQQLNWGYFDHPPMIGWWFAALSQISTEAWFLRLPTVLQWSVISLFLVDLAQRLRPDNPAAAYWGTSILLLMPFAWSLNLITNDTPLIYFVFFSFYVFVRASLQPSHGLYLLSGVLLGLAFLSKYFAALLALAYLVYLVREKKFAALAWMILGAASPALINVYYNATNCWNNYMFNVINRNENTTWSWVTVVVYVAMMVYLVTPWLSFAVIQRIRSLGHGPAWAAHRLLFVFFAAPLLVLLLVSTRRSVGLHWVLAFLPMVFLYYTVLVPGPVLTKHLKWGMGWFVAHALAVLGFVFLPLSVWEGQKLYKDLVFHHKTAEIVAQLRSDSDNGTQLMARSYTPASILAFHAKVYVPVFGAGRFHARQDDSWVDFRSFNGKNIRIFDRAPMAIEDLAPFFLKVEIRSFKVAGAEFWYADGESFNFQMYKHQILQAIANDHYNIPSFLPVYACPFLDRYELTPHPEKQTFPGHRL